MTAAAYYAGKRNADQSVFRQGFFDNVPEDRYHADRSSLSVSGAKLMLKAPALYQHRLDNPEHSDAFDLGSAAHALVLGVGAPIVPIDSDSWRSKYAQQLRNEAREAGNIPLLEKDYATVQAMADALSSHTLAMRLLSTGKPEVSAYAKDPETGVLMRCRFDWLSDNYAVDYKSTVCAEPGAFAASCARYGYHQQAAWYLDVASLLGRPLDSFAFIAQEKVAPYLVSVIELDAASVQRGRDLNRRALEMYRDCQEAGVFPGYQAPDTYTTVALPRWAFYDNDTQEIAL